MRDANTGTAGPRDPGPERLDGVDQTVDRRASRSTRRSRDRSLYVLHHPDNRKTQCRQSADVPRSALLCRYSRLLRDSKRVIMSTSTIPIPRDPTDDEALALFKTVEEKFPSRSLGGDKWYVLLVWDHPLYTYKSSD